MLDQQPVSSFVSPQWTRNRNDQRLTQTAPGLNNSTLSAAELLDTWAEIKQTMSQLNLSSFHSTPSHSKSRSGSGVKTFPNNSNAGSSSSSVRSKRIGPSNVPPLRLSGLSGSAIVPKSIAFATPSSSLVLSDPQITPSSTTVAVGAAETQPSSGSSVNSSLLPMSPQRSHMPQRHHSSLKQTQKSVISKRVSPLRNPKTILDQSLHISPPSVQYERDLLNSQTFNKLSNFPPNSKYKSFDLLAEFNDLDSNYDNTATNNLNNTNNHETRIEIYKKIENPNPNPNPNFPPKFTNNQTKIDNTVITGEITKSDSQPNSPERALRQARHRPNNPNNPDNPDNSDSSPVRVISGKNMNLKAIRARTTPETHHLALAQFPLVEASSVGSAGPEPLSVKSLLSTELNVRSLKHHHHHGDIDDHSRHLRSHIHRERGHETTPQYSYSSNSDMSTNTPNPPYDQAPLSLSTHHTAHPHRSPVSSKHTEIVLRSRGNLGDFGEESEGSENQNHPHLSVPSRSTPSARPRPFPGRLPITSSSSSSTGSVALNRIGAGIIPNDRADQTGRARVSPNRPENHSNNPIPQRPDRFSGGDFIISSIGAVGSAGLNNTMTTKSLNKKSPNRQQSNDDNVDEDRNDSHNHSPVRSQVSRRSHSPSRPTAVSLIPPRLRSHSPARDQNTAINSESPATAVKSVKNAEDFDPAKYHPISPYRAEQDKQRRSEEYERELESLEQGKGGSPGRYGYGLSQPQRSKTQKARVTPVVRVIGSASMPMTSESVREDILSPVLYNTYKNNEMTLQGEGDENSSPYSPNNPNDSGKDDPHQDRSLCFPIRSPHPSRARHHGQHVNKNKNKKGSTKSTGNTPQNNQNQTGGVRDRNQGNQSENGSGGVSPQRRKMLKTQQLHTDPNMSVTGSGSQSPPICPIGDVDSSLSLSNSPHSNNPNNPDIPDNPTNPTNPVVTGPITTSITRAIQDDSFKGSENHTSKSSPSSHLNNLGTLKGSEITITNFPVSNGIGGGGLSPLKSQKSNKPKKSSSSQLRHLDHSESFNNNYDDNTAGVKDKNTDTAGLSLSSAGVVSMTPSILSNQEEQVEQLEQVDEVDELERRAVKRVCEECEDGVTRARMDCAVCGQVLCDLCDAQLHLKGNRRYHKRTKLPSPSPSREESVSSTVSAAAKRSSEQQLSAPVLSSPSSPSPSPSAVTSAASVAAEESSHGSHDHSDHGSAHNIINNSTSSLALSNGPNSVSVSPVTSNNPKNLSSNPSNNPNNPDKDRASGPILPIRLNFSDPSSSTQALAKSEGSESRSEESDNDEEAVDRAMLESMNEAKRLKHKQHELMMVITNSPKLSSSNRSNSIHAITNPSDNPSNPQVEPLSDSIFSARLSASLSNSPNKPNNPNHDGSNTDLISPSTYQKSLKLDENFRDLMARSPSPTYNDVTAFKHHNLSTSMSSLSEGLSKGPGSEPGSVITSVPVSGREGSENIRDNPNNPELRDISSSMNGLSEGLSERVSGSGSAAASVSVGSENTRDDERESEAVNISVWGYNPSLIGTDIGSGDDEDDDSLLSPTRHLSQNMNNHVIRDRDRDRETGSQALDRPKNGPVEAVGDKGAAESSIWGLNLSLIGTDIASDDDDSLLSPRRAHHNNVNTSMSIGSRVKDYAHNNRDNDRDRDREGSVIISSAAEGSESGDMNHEAKDYQHRYTNPLITLL